MRYLLLLGVLMMFLIGTPIPVLGTDESGGDEVIPLDPRTSNSKLNLA